jgi:hypothetical protein
MKKLYPLLLFFLLWGCSWKSKPLRESYYKTFFIINNTEFDVKLVYLTKINEAFWILGSDKYEYETKVIPEFENESVTIVVSEYDEYDILTFSNDENVAEIIGYWREFGTIIVGFENGEFVFDFRL